MGEDSWEKHSNFKISSSLIPMGIPIFVNIMLKYLKNVAEVDVSLDASVFKCVPIMVGKETVYCFITDITEVLLLAYQQIKVLHQICVFFLFKIENPMRFFMKCYDIQINFWLAHFKFWWFFCFENRIRRHYIITRTFKIKIASNKCNQLIKYACVFLFENVKIMNEKNILKLKSNPKSKFIWNEQSYAH